MHLQFDKLFCNELHSDMTFLIEKENIEYPAHKLIVGYASEVLNKMVYGNGGALSASMIVVPNCSSNVFLSLLKFIYTGNLEWSLDTYDGVLEVAKYFGLTKCEKLFKIYVAATINFDNVLEIYARFFHVNDYICRTAMKIIQLILARILEDENKIDRFFELPNDALSQILQMDELNVESEVDLFERMITWAKTKDQQNLSAILDSKINLIRFGSTHISNNGINTELNDYLQAKLNSRWKIQIFQYTNETFSSENGGALQHEGHEIISVGCTSVPMRLHGFSIVSSDEIYLQKDDHFEVISCYRSKVFKRDVYDLMFESPIEISKNETVHLKVPASSRRYDLKDDDDDDDPLFSVRAIHMLEPDKNLPMAAIFISTI